MQNNNNNNNNERDYNKLVDYLFEAGLQKNVKRSGWWVAGVKDPETIAEHSQRAAIIAYIIASLEGADAQKAACICMIHDMGETRINDSHKIAAQYLSLKKGEDQAFSDQAKMLPLGIAKDFEGFFREFQDRSSKEGVIARDADYVECALQAKEYLDLGYKATQDWLDNISIEGRLKTKSAKKIFEIIITKDSKEWFKGLKNLKEEI